MSTEDKIQDYISGAWVHAKPEEVQAVQPMLRFLVDQLGYSKSQIQAHPQVRVKRRPSDKQGYPMDIVVYTDETKKVLKMIIECKQTGEDLNEAESQVRNYMQLNNCKLGVVHDGVITRVRYMEDLSNSDSTRSLNSIPNVNETVDNMGMYRKEMLVVPHNLKAIFEELHGWLVANGNVTREEAIADNVIKMILCKIFDEDNTKKKDLVAFRAEVKESDETILARFNELKKNYIERRNINSDEFVITFDAKTVRGVIEKLQSYSITEAKRDVVSDAYEIFISKSVKQTQGQFFTPRPVISLLIHLLIDLTGASVEDLMNYKVGDSSGGSAGMLAGWISILEDKMDSIVDDYGWNEYQKAERLRNIISSKVIGIEKDPFLAKISKDYLSILGGCDAKIHCADSLEIPSNWSEALQKDAQMGTFDAILNNPPFGQNIKVEGKDKLEQYSLGKNKNNPRISSLFIERNLQLTKDGGHGFIILSESNFHAKSYKAERDLLFKHNIKAVVDLPVVTFAPYTMTKCCVVVYQKNVPQQKKIKMITLDYVGHDKDGKKIDRDDCKTVIEAIVNKTSCPEHICEVDADVVISSHNLVPRSYRNCEITSEQNKQSEEEGVEWVSMKTLLDEGIIEFYNGHGSPKSEFKGVGKYPYIRVKDIVQWGVYKDVTAFLPEEEYNRLAKCSVKLQAKDILYVARGSKRIGSVALVSPHDTDVVITKEIKIFRMVDCNNKYGITPEYLCVALSHKNVFEQTQSKVLIETSFGNIGDRWKELMIPVYTDKSKQQKAVDETAAVFKERWEFVSKMEDMKKNYHSFMV